MKVMYNHVNLLKKMESKLNKQVSNIERSCSLVILIDNQKDKTLNRLVQQNLPPGLEHSLAPDNPDGTTQDMNYPSPQILRSFGMRQLLPKY